MLQVLCLRISWVDLHCTENGKMRFAGHPFAARNVPDLSCAIVLSCAPWRIHWTRSPSSALLWGGVCLLNRLQKKGYPCSNLSTGGPSGGLTTKAPNKKITERSADTRSCSPTRVPWIASSRRRPSSCGRARLPRKPGLKAG